MWQLTLGGVGMNGLGLLLGSIDSEIHNLSIHMKAPFRKVLCDRYKGKFNNELLFKDFLRDMKDINVWNKFYNNAICGQGLFLHHLFHAYQEQGVPAKLITTTEQMAGYLSHYHKYTVMDIDDKRTTDVEEKIKVFTKSDINILSLNTSSLAGAKYSQKKLFLRNVFEIIASLSAEGNVIYLLCLLHVDKEEKTVLENRENIRLVQFQTVNQINKLNPLELNIYIPHVNDGNKKSDVEKITRNFPGVDDWVFKKDYFSYHHFVFNNGGKTGFYFMNYKKKEM